MTDHGTNEAIELLKGGRTMYILFLRLEGEEFGGGYGKRIKPLLAAGT